VSDVAPNTPAERAGLLKGDILLSMAGKRPDTLASLADFMSKLVAVDRSEKTSEPIEVTVQRRGEDKPVKLLVEREPAPMPARPATPRPGLPSRDLTLPNTRHLVLGVEVREQGPRVVVTRIMERKPADLAGIQPGDAIVGVGRKPINSHAALVSAIAPYEPGDELPVEIMRGDKTAVVRVKVINARPSEEDVVLASTTEVAAPPTVALPVQGQDQLTLAEEVRMLRARVDALEQVVKQLVQQLGQKQQR
jgi:S1-C subfamily serine protease